MLSRRMRWGLMMVLAVAASAGTAAAQEGLKLETPVKPERPAAKQGGLGIVDVAPRPPQESGEEGATKREPLAERKYLYSPYVPANRFPYGNPFYIRNSRVPVYYYYHGWQRGYHMGPFYFDPNVGNLNTGF